ncbi:E3 SUMO-protein ligase NSE2 [Marchantia polymorpha subsp. ruderalis]
MTQEVKCGKKEEVNFPKAMAVKKELVSPVSVQDFLSENKSETQEKNPRTPPLTSCSEDLECWKAPVKPERSLVNRIVKEEKSWIRVVADCVEKSKNCSMVDAYEPFNDSPLRSCPKFDKMLGNSEETFTRGKTQGDKISVGPLLDEGDQESRTPMKFCSKFEKTVGSVDDGCKKTSKTKVDFSGGELSDDFEDENDDTCMTGSKYGVVNTRCPLSGKLVTELDDPVQSVNCHHVYDRAFATAYISQFPGIRKCAVAGCSKFLIQRNLVCDTTLEESIQDLREKNFTSKLQLLMECIHIDDD